MTILLDTHVVLWWHAGDRRLSAAAREAVERADLAYVSAASGWEVALKLGTGKLRLEVPFDDIVVRNGVTELGVTLRHARQLAVVPMRHRDPFDRMLVAQAMVEGATLVSRDFGAGRLRRPDRVVTASRRLRPALSIVATGSVGLGQRRLVGQANGPALEPASLQTSAWTD